MYWETKLAIMPMLPTLCVCEKTDYNIWINDLFNNRLLYSENSNLDKLGGSGMLS